MVSNPLRTPSFFLNKRGCSGHTSRGSFGQSPMGTFKRWWVIFTKPAPSAQDFRFGPGEGSRPQLRNVSVNCWPHLRSSWSSVSELSSEYAQGSASRNSTHPPGLVKLSENSACQLDANFPDSRIGVFLNLKACLIKPGQSTIEQCMFREWMKSNWWP